MTSMVLTQSYQAQVGKNGELVLTLPPGTLQQLGLQTGSLVSVTISSIAPINAMQAPIQYAMQTPILGGAPSTVGVAIIAEAKPEKKEERRHSGTLGNL